jgi:hypothetical protein
MKKDEARMGVTIFKMGKRRGSYLHIKGSEMDTLLSAISKYTKRKGFLFCVHYVKLDSRDNLRPNETEAYR